MIEKRHIFWISVATFLMFAVSCEKKGGTEDFTSTSSLSVSWKNVSKNRGDEAVKYRLYREIALSLAARSETLEVIGLIESTFEKGELRSRLITELFSFSDTSLSNLVGNWTHLKEDYDRNAALLGIADVVSRQDDFTDLRASDLKKLGTSASVVVGTGLAKRTSDAINGDELKSAVVEAVAVVRRLQKEGGLSQEFSKDCMAKIAAVAPFEVWEAWNAGSVGAGDPEVLRAIAWEMAAVDPGRAMEAMNRDAGGTGTSDVFRRWTETAPDEAEAWLAKNAESLPAEEREWIIAFEAKRAIATGDFAKAWDRAGKLTDAKSKRELEGAIWTKERNLLRAEVDKDAQGTVESIVSGKSPHAPYWLEVAIVSWAKKDLDAAQGWYQKNWNGLDPDKAQYVAAAFAVLARDAGEFPAAKQWAGHIRDEKTKKRVTESIAKAEAGKDSKLPEPK